MGPDLPPESPEEMKLKIQLVNSASEEGGAALPFSPIAQVPEFLEVSGRIGFNEVRIRLYRTLKVYIKAMNGIYLRAGETHG